LNTIHCIMYLATQIFYLGEFMKKNNTIVAIIAVAMLIILAIDIYELFTPENKISISFSILGTLLATYYGFIGYKKPNGNLLKYLFVAYGLCIGLYGIFRSAKYVPTSYLYFLGAIVIVYVAGRLDRISQNKYLMVLAFLFVLVGYITKCFVRGDSLFTLIRLADELYLLIALCAFYFIRYKEHKEAGVKANS